MNSKPWLRPVSYRNTRLTQNFLLTMPVFVPLNNLLWTPSLPFFIHFSPFSKCGTAFLLEKFLPKFHIPSSEKLSFSKNIPKEPRNFKYKTGPKSLNRLVCKIVWNGKQTNNYTGYQIKVKFLSIIPLSTFSGASILAILGKETIQSKLHKHWEDLYLSEHYEIERRPHSAINLCRQEEHVTV